MDEQQKTIERLAGRTGYDAEEVEHLLTSGGYTEEEMLLEGQDDDLWLIESMGRWVSTDPNEEVKEWKDAVGQDGNARERSLRRNYPVRLQRRRRGVSGRR